MAREGHQPLGSLPLKGGGRGGGPKLVLKMTDAPSDDEPPLDPQAAKVVRRVRLMMLVSALTTLIAVAAVLGVIGYRMFRSEGPVVAAEATGLLPKNARIVSTAVAEDRIVVVLDVGGATEIRTYDLRSLKPAGRLRF